MTSKSLRKKGLEVLRTVDPVDEYCAQQLNELDGKKLKSTTREGLDVEDEDEKRKARGPEGLTKLIKEVLGENEMSTHRWQHALTSTAFRSAWTGCGGPHG